MRRLSTTYSLPRDIMIDSFRIRHTRILCVSLRMTNYLPSTKKTMSIMVHVTPPFSEKNLSRSHEAPKAVDATSRADPIRSFSPSIQRLPGDDFVIKKKLLFVTRMYETLTTPSRHTTTTSDGGSKNSHGVLPYTVPQPHHQFPRPPSFRRCSLSCRLACKKIRAGSQALFDEGGPCRHTLPGCFSRS